MPVTLPGFNWQFLGAFVNAGVNLTDWHLDQFAGAGGRWLIPCLYQLSRDDDDATAWNRTNIEGLKERCLPRGIRVGGWYNGWGGDPEKDAATLASFHRTHGLGPVVLDLESAYQGNNLMAAFTLAVREQFPVGTKPVAVSTNALNDACVYNGRLGATSQPGDKSFYDLAIRVLPQWYDSPNYSGCWTDPVCHMQWLQKHGADDNLHDPNAPEGRAVPSAWVKGTLEVTGLESSSLDGEISSCVSAKAFGFTKGVQLYLLENIPPGDPHGDFSRIAAQRNVLFV